MDSTISMSMQEVTESFVDNNLMNKVGEILNEAKVSVGTVHHTLALMIADDINENADNISEALASLMSLQHFMYIAISSMAQEKHKRSAH